MPVGESRSLPSRPSLRYLKLEAKRRRLAGEFPTLHEAQLAVARELGLPSWAALKRYIADRSRSASPALEHLRWAISRFADADEPDWVVPGEEELRRHFDDRLLSRRQPDRLIAMIAAMAPDLRHELIVMQQTPLAVHAHLAGIEIVAAAAAEPPHRLIGVRRRSLGSRITDPRVAHPTTRTEGEVPVAVMGIVEEAFTELGLVGMVFAGGSPNTPVWVAARGWADLARGEFLRTRHRFPVYGITHPVTATAVLRLVADGRVGLDSPANDYLRAVRLADEAVTVRDLLSHTGGVDHPVQPLVDRVPELVNLVGPVILCTGERGIFRYSNEGFAALGQLIADVTGSSYPDAVRHLVFAPLGMHDSSFPDRWPDHEPAAITGYHVAAEGAFVAEPPLICTMPAAGGLWATAADLVRFGLGWSSLLPEALVHEALRPQVATGEPGSALRGQHGLGWIIDEPSGVIGSAGGGIGASTSLLIRLADNQTHVALTNRRAQIEPINGQVLRVCVGSGDAAS